jgi:hypothetical protein
MASLARTVLRSSGGPHRSLHRVFSAQLRHLHEPAEKKHVFHWEVRCPSPLHCRLLETNSSVSRTRWTLTANCLKRK